MRKRFLLAIVLFVLAIGIVACERKNDNTNINVSLEDMQPTDESLFIVENETIMGFVEDAVIEKKIVIPESINGNVITKISENAFSENQTIEGIRIPDTVTEIGEQAFLHCENLSDVILPANLTSISRNIFGGTAIESIVIPEKVQSIEGYAFYDCAKLCEINIPSSVKTIDNFAFNNIYNLTKITVAEENANFASENGVLFNKEKTNLIKYPSNKEDIAYILPSEVKEISIGAFSNLKNLKNLNLANVEKVGNIAFHSSESLEEIVFGSAFVEPYDGIAYLFRYCPKIKKIEIAEDNAKFSATDGAIYNKEKTELLYYPHDIENVIVTIPNGVEKIGEAAFVECENIRGLNISSTVKVIGRGAFAGCINLKNVTVPDNVITIEERAFLDVPKTAVKLPSSIKNVEEIFIDNLQDEE